VAVAAVQDLLLAVAVARFHLQGVTPEHLQLEGQEMLDRQAFKVLLTLGEMAVL
jgi:hypothetical protein